MMMNMVTVAHVKNTNTNQFVSLSPNPVTSSVPYLNSTIGVKSRQPRSNALRLHCQMA